MKYVADIADGKVSSVICAPDEYELSEDQVMIGPENTIGIGTEYRDGAFVIPDSEEENG